MKKTVCILLSVLLLFCLAACKGESTKTESKAPTGEIDKYASKGVIPEIPVKIKTSKDDAVKLYEEAGDADSVLNVLEGETAVCLSNGTVSFYYEKEKENKGIGAIVVMSGKAFGLDIGGVTTKSDVTALISEDYKTATATEEDVFFLPAAPENCEMICCEYKDLVLKFFFIDGFLSSTVLYSAELWS